MFCFWDVCWHIAQNQSIYNLQCYRIRQLTSLISPGLYTVILNIINSYAIMLQDSEVVISKHQQCFAPWLYTNLLHSVYENYWYHNIRNMQSKYTTRISFLKKLSIFQQLTKVGCCRTIAIRKPNFSDESNDRSNDTASLSPSPRAEMAMGWCCHSMSQCIQVIFTERAILCYTT